MYLIDGIFLSDIIIVVNCCVIIFIIFVCVCDCFDLIVNVFRKAFFTSTLKFFGFIVKYFRFILL